MQTIISIQTGILALAPVFIHGGLSTLQPSLGGLSLLTQGPGRQNDLHCHSLASSGVSSFLPPSPAVTLALCNL